MRAFKFNWQTITLRLSVYFHVFDRSTEGPEKFKGSDVVSRQYGDLLER